jgi:hypothetical protein
MRPLLILAMLALATLVPVVAADAPKLPTDAQKAMDKLEKSEGKLTTDYKKSLNAERAKTIAELQKAQKDVTKSGDLDGALAIKKQIEALQEKIAKDEDTDLLGNKKIDPAKLLIGRWDYQKTNGVGGVVEFLTDGRFSASITTPVNFPYVPGKWEIKGEQVLLTWLNDPNKVDTLTFTAATKMAGDSHDVGKNSVNATKLSAEK